MYLSVQLYPVVACHAVFAEQDWFLIPFIQEERTPVQHLRCHRPTHLCTCAADVGVFCIAVGIFRCLALVDVYTVKINRLRDNFHVTFLDFRHIVTEDLIGILRVFSEEDRVCPPGQFKRETILCKSETFLLCLCNCLRCIVGRCAARGRKGKTDGRFLLCILANDLNCLAVGQQNIVCHTGQIFCLVYFKGGKLADGIAAADKYLRFVNGHPVLDTI